MTSIKIIRQRILRTSAYACLATATAVSTALADTVSYTLNDVFLLDGSPITGAFDWTFTPGDFEGGSGTFTALEIPYRPGGTAPPLEDPNMVLIIENNQIEITLDGNFHDYGLNVSLKFLDPLSPTQPSALDLSTSFFECCGNGFKDQAFSSGSISPTLTAVPLPASLPLLAAGMGVLSLFKRKGKGSTSLA